MTLQIRFRRQSQGIIPIVVLVDKDGSETTLWASSTPYKSQREADVAAGKSCGNVMLAYRIGQIDPIG